MTSHIRVEQTPKGNTYLISQAFLEQQYPSDTTPPMLPALDQQPEVATLQE